MRRRERPPRYRVVAAGALEHEIRRLRRRFPDVYQALVSAVEVLEADPFNTERRVDIRKLTAVPAGEGQYRLRVGDCRLRYDVMGEDVVLHSLRRRDQSYR